MQHLRAHNFSPDLTSQERIDGIEPVVDFLVEESLQQVASVFGDDTNDEKRN